MIVFKFRHLQAFNQDYPQTCWRLFLFPLSSHRICLENKGANELLCFHAMKSEFEIRSSIYAFYRDCEERNT